MKQGKLVIGLKYFSWVINYRIASYCGISVTIITVIIMNYVIKYEQVYCVYFIGYMDINSLYIFLNIW